jgi:hypothetical protein
MAPRHLYRSGIALAIAAAFFSATIKPARGQTPSPPPPAYPYPPPAYPYPPPAYPYPPPPGYPPYQLSPPPPAAPVPPALDDQDLPKVHHAYKGALIAGLITFGTSWGFAVLIAGAFSRENSSPSNTGDDCSARQTCAHIAEVLWIPLAGPLLARGVDSSDMPPFDIVVFWTIAEVAGAALTAVGMIGHTVPDRRARRRWAALNLVPMVSRDQGGLALGARW